MTACPRFFLCLASMGMALLPLALMAQPPKDSLDRDYAGELPRIPLTEPANALKTFHVAPGFRVEQVAAEPLVADPVAVAFDENARLYVVEMRGYSENKDEKVSRIRLLEDTNGDGKFDKSTIFLDGLAWPTAIFCWSNGVIVADAPDIFYLKDTDGDGKADERRLLYTGLGTGNVQGLANSFQWGLDNRIYLAISGSGAELKKAGDEQARPMTLRGRDIAIEPRTWAVAPVSGGAQ
ncbi:MAG TPA: PVC-type heme-binding CxxCH protein, partial [Pirellulaceae bacterium]|nr:PVC-type heme-binding CxxCH protein [Pirellulaceae bacterium]